VFRGALYGRRALEQLGAATAPAAELLELDLGAVTRADTYTGVVMRAAVELQLRRGEAHRAAIAPPRNSAARATIDTLLAPLPSRSTRVDEPPRVSPSPHVHVPTLTIADEDDLRMVADLVLPSLASRRVVRVRDARTLQRAVMALGENALRYGGGPSPAIFAVALEPMGNELQLVVSDLGPGLPEGEAIRAVVAHSRGELGGLESLAMMAQRTDVDLSLRLISGASRAHWRHGRWRYDDDGVAVPGWTAAVEIHL
jgi:hypothetical protein